MIWGPHSLAPRPLSGHERCGGAGLRWSRRSQVLQHLAALPAGWKLSLVGVGGSQCRRAGGGREDVPGNRASRGCRTNIPSPTSASEALEVTVPGPVRRP